MQDTIDLDALLKKPTPQDVIGTIFAYSGLTTFRSNRERLHRFIREKKIKGAVELLDPFVFSEGVDLFPFSRLFENVLMQLQLGGWLSAKNPEYEKFGMTDAQVKEAQKPMELKPVKKNKSVECFGCGS